MCVDAMFEKFVIVKTGLVLGFNKMIFETLGSHCSLMLS